MLTNIRVLNQKNNKYYFNGKSFTGVTFKIFGERLEDFCEFEDGNYIRPYECIYFPKAKNLIHINIEYIEFQGEYLDEGAIYKGQKFSGVAYELEDSGDFCYAKHLFEQGIPIGSIVWNEAGNIQDLKLSQEGITQSYSWDEDGLLRLFCIHSSKESDNLISISLTEQSKLENVWINNKYFDWIAKNQDQIKFSYFNNPDSFNEFVADKNFGAYGYGVNDTVFYAIACYDGFKNISEIIVFRTSLSDSTLLSLADIKNLKKFELEDRNRDFTNIVKEIKLKKPDLSIKVN